MSPDIVDSTVLVETALNIFTSLKQMAARIAQKSQMKQIFQHIPLQITVKKETPGKKYKKKTIPVALREQVWLRACGRVFEHKCITPWCKNTLTVFDFESGHNIPESKGGPTTINNLIPLCRRCNNSMGDRYTFDEWARLETPSIVVEAAPAPAPVPRTWKQFFSSCFTNQTQT